MFRNHLLPLIVASCSSPWALSFCHFAPWTTRMGVQISVNPKMQSLSLLHSQHSSENSQAVEDEQHRSILQEWNHLRAKMKENMQSSAQRDVQVLQEAEDSVREELRSAIQDLRAALLNQTAAKMPNEDQKVQARQSIHEQFLQTQKQIKGDLRVLCQTQQNAIHNLTLEGEEGFAEFDTFIQTMAMQEPAPYSNLSEFKGWMSDNIPQQYQQLEPIMKVVDMLGSPSFQPNPKEIQRNQNNTIHQPLQTFRRDMKDQLQDLQDSMEFQICSYL